MEEIAMVKKELTAALAAEGAASAPALYQHELSAELQTVIEKIEGVLEETQESNLRALWTIGSLISDVRNRPEVYLTAEQQAAHISGDAVIMSIFAPVYSNEQLRGAVGIFEAYPEKSDLDRLLSLRSPARAQWRITAAHAQLLAQIPDNTQRAAVEARCADEAYSSRLLAAELREIRGPSSSATKAGRPHEAPKSLKNQLVDLLQHQKRFIARSENLWLNEESDNIYDELANTPPAKITTTITDYFQEITENFALLQEHIDNHRAMCRKIQERVFDPLEADATEEVDAADDDEHEEVEDLSAAETFSATSRLTKTRE